MSEQIEHAKQMATVAVGLLGIGAVFLLALRFGVSPWLAAFVVLSIAPAYGLRRLIQIRALASWERVPAVVECAEIRSRPIPGEHLSHREYYPVITVRHQVGPEHIRSECYSSIAYDYASRDPKEVQALVNGYSAGQAIAVLRNPASPSQVSIVDRVSPEKRQHYLAITIGGFLAFATLVGVWGAIAL